MALYSNSSAGLAIRWISSMNSTSPAPRLVRIAARSPERSITGPLVVRMPVPSSAATMFANVVFPKPGGPDKRI
jgi:hypothetical protein